MDGKHHKMFAPAFTLGMAELMLQTGIINESLGQMGVILATAASLTTATMPDADLFASYPTVAILDAAPYKKRNGYYMMRGRNGQIKKYRPPKNIITRYIALFFKSIGVRKHRDWRTHAPTIYFPLGFLIIKLTNKLQLSGDMETFTASLQAIIIGMVLGYLSHIVADIPNKGGIPLGPSNKQYSITRRIFGKRFSNFFRSSNKVWNTIFIAAIIDFSLFVINRDLALKFNMQIFNIVKTILKPLLNLLTKVFQQLLG